MNIPLLVQQAPLNTDSLRQAIEGIDDSVITEETISIWQLIQDGGWYIMGPLALLSIIAIYILIERTLAINRASKEDKDFMNKIRDYVHEGKVDSAKNLCHTIDTPIARIIAKGIGRIGKPMRDIAVSIENAGKLEIYQMEKGLGTLATIAGAAPMLGFLGTVIGMIVTFHTMKISGAGVEIDKLSGGIMQAMVTTVAGLIIGIVAYIAYNSLVARVNKVVHMMEASSIEFLDLLEEPGK
jgi:biopolymer transport protein ExbB